MPSSSDLPNSNLYTHRSDTPTYLWYHRLIALIALLNFGLVCFDLSYVPLRDIYLQYVPALTQQYDPIKGIEPHPVTQQYLNQVDRLQSEIERSGLQSEPTQAILSELRRTSQHISINNPFEVAGESRFLAKITQEVNQRTGVALGDSGFERFWSVDYLSQAGWQQELAFFNTEFRPLIAANYYRDIDRYGRFVDRFWILDLPFMVVLGLDFLGRTYVISRRRPDLNWLEAILRRWHDLFFFIPFWRWLRVLPVTLRLYRAKLLNLKPVVAQINHDFAIGFAQELIEVVGVQVIEQMQASVRDGDVTRWLLYPETRLPYVPVNNINEIGAIASRLLSVSVYDVLPQIQPDVEALVHHRLNQSLNQIPAYQQLQRLPGFNGLQTQLTERLSRDLLQAIYSNLVNTMEDPVAADLSTRLGNHFRDALQHELQKTENVQQLQAWVIDLLEEIKLNYVKRVAEGNIEDAVERVEQMHRLSIGQR